MNYWDQLLTNTKTWKPKDRLGHWQFQLGAIELPNVAHTNYLQWHQRWNYGIQLQI